MSAIEGVAPTTSEIRAMYGATPAKRPSVRIQSAQAEVVNVDLASVTSSNTVNNAASSVADRSEQNSAAKKDERVTDDVESTVEETNSRLEMENWTMRFRVNRDSGDVQIHIVDLARDKIIRSIPFNDMLKLSSRIWSKSGLGSMVDTSR